MRSKSGVVGWLATVSAAVSIAAPARAELTLLPTRQAAAMVQALIDAGIEVVGASFEGGEPLQWSYFPFTSGTYQSGGLGPVGTFTDGPLGMRDGLLMTNGEIGLAKGPNVSLPGNNAVAVGDRRFEGATGVLTPDIGPAPADGTAEAFCSGLIGGDLSISPHDVVKLTIDFKLAAGYDGIQIDYVFGSEEYPDYAPGGAAGQPNYPDAFGFFVRPAGQTVFTNFGREPTGGPININTPFFAGDRVIKTYDGGTVVSEYNGLTPHLRSAMQLDAGAGVHRVVIVICDAGDQWLDSGVFVRALAGCNGACDATTWCGDGKVQGGEACDDGNVVDRGDGCTASCQIETCLRRALLDLHQAPAVSPCARRSCGDGVVQALAASSSAMTPERQQPRQLRVMPPRDVQRRADPRPGKRHRERDRLRWRVPRLPARRPVQRPRRLRQRLLRAAQRHLSAAPGDGRDRRLRDGARHHADPAAGARSHRQRRQRRRRDLRAGARHEPGRRHRHVEQRHRQLCGARGLRRA